MEPKIVSSAGLTLAGFTFFGDPFEFSAGWTEENEIGKLWRRFMAYLEQNPALHARFRAPVSYEVHIIHPETERTGEHEVFIGMEVNAAKPLPPQLSLKQLPATEYAVFTLQGEQIAGDWTQAMLDWLAASEFHGVHGYNFQRYDERFKGLDRLSESTLEVYLPVARRD